MPRGKNLNWDLIKEDYLFSDPQPTAAQLAKKYNCSLSAVRQKISNEKWRSLRENVGISIARSVPATENQLAKVLPKPAPRDGGQNLAKELNADPSLVHELLEQMKQVWADDQLAIVADMQQAIKTYAAAGCTLEPSDLKQLASALRELVQLQRLIMSVPDKSKAIAPREHHQHIHVDTSEIDRLKQILGGNDEGESEARVGQEPEETREEQEAPAEHNGEEGSQ